jgi:GTP-binding protein EngB required for normal cell division
MCPTGPQARGKGFSSSATPKQMKFTLGSVTIGSAVTMGGAFSVYHGTLAEETPIAVKYHGEGTMNVAKVQEILSGPETKLLVWGETGEGKSTLINDFRDSDQPEASTSRNPNGETREISIYKGTVGAKKVLFIDVPGVGSQSVGLADLLRTFEKSLTTVDGIIVCTKVDKNRITFGTQFVQVLVERCLCGSNKWSNIILCGTQADRCSLDEIEGFRTIVKDNFNEKVGGNVTKVAVVSNSKKHGGYGELEKEIQKLPEATDLKYYIRKGRTNALFGTFLQNTGSL